MVPETAAIVKLAIYVAVLVPACLSDVRDREASNGYWMVLGAAGVAFMAWDSMGSLGPWRALPILGVLSILLYFLWPGEEDPVNPLLFLALTVALFGFPVYFAWDDAFVRTATSVPIVIGVFVSLYYIGVVRGGADVKCLMATAVMFPTYPVFNGAPLIDVPAGILPALFPFVVATFLLAALFSLLPLPAIAVRNLARGDRRMPQMLSGYVLPLEKARAKHVWPLENVVDGTHVFMSSPQDGPGVYDALESMGREEIWVTPKIPFLIPILAATIFVALVGNPFFLLV